MGGLLSIPYQSEDYQLDVTWPIITNAAVGAAFQAAGNPKYGIGTGYGVFSALTGAATNNMTLHNGILVGQFTCGAGATSERTLDGFSMFIPLLRGATAVGMKFGVELRVWRWTVTIALNAAVNITDETGVAIEPAAGAAPGWIRSNRGFGVVGDGAGGWRFVAKNAAGVGVYSDSVALTWPSPVTDFVTVDFEMVSASGAGDAVLNLYLNNVLQLSRSWGAGTVLPDYTSPATAARFVPHVRAGDGGLVTAVHVAAGMRFMAGRFTLAGAVV